MDKQFKMDFTAMQITEKRSKIDILKPRRSILMDSALPSPADDAPFFADNLPYYPRLKQRYNTSSQPQQEEQPLQQEQEQKQQQQPLSYDAEIWQLLGKNIANCIKQPNGQPLVSLSKLAAMSAVDMASVLLSAHLLQQRQGDCVLSQYRDHEMRSYVLKSNDVRDVLHRCEQRVWRTPIFNAMPCHDAPMARRVQMPPRQWLRPIGCQESACGYKDWRSKQSNGPEMNGPHCDWQAKEAPRQQRELHVSSTLPQSKSRPWPELEPQPDADQQTEPEPEPMQDWVYSRRNKKKKAQANLGGHANGNRNRTLTGNFHQRTCHMQY